MIHSFIPNNREAWLAVRRQYITATDVVAIEGLSSFASAHEVLLDKKGLLPRKPGNRAMAIGNLLEPLIRAEFARKYDVQAWESQGERIYCDDARHLAATPDGLFLQGEDRLILEIKTSMNNWREIPARVLLQVKHQAVLGEASKGFIAHLHVPEEAQEEILVRAALGQPLSLEGLGAIETYPFSFAAEDLEAHAQRYHVWYENHILFGAPLPEQMPSPKPELTQSVSDDQLVSAWFEKKRLADEHEEQAKAYKAQRKEIEDQLVALYPDAKKFLGGGNAVSRSFTAGAMKVDNEGLLNAIVLKHPELNPEVRSLEPNFITYGSGYSRWIPSKKKEA
jgi:putative phage-type endonuclease